MSRALGMSNLQKASVGIKRPDNGGIDALPESYFPPNS